tara:strand:+ start:222 stop:923 length:702 start_codon:yes stop_codon:yes gene_type:complete
MRILDLFAGTKSVSKVCDKLKWDSVSVDMILPADYRIDIMDFEYKKYPKDYFDIIWASPPCVAYSTLQNCWKGRMRNGKIFTQEDINNMMIESDKLVLKTFEIIDYFDIKYWFIENPQTGNLKKRDIMKDKPFYDVDYCMYSDWGYKKRTRIWTNKKDFEPKLCDGKGTCGNMKDRKHKKDLGTSAAPGGGSQKNEEKDLKHLGKGTNRIDKYRIPEDLIFSLFKLSSIGDTL